MVATWISYRDVVICLIIVSRFLHLLERKYGNPYAHMGRLFVQNTPDGFSKTWRINLAGLYRLMGGLGHFTIHSHQRIKK